jgi:hypothetical protein
VDIFFNDYKLPNVISYQVGRATRNTKTEYNARGDMLIDMVSRKHILTVYLGGLRSQDLRHLLTITDTIFFNVRFESPALGQINSQFHMKENVAETDFVFQGITYYKALKLTLEER